MPLRSMRKGDTLCCRLYKLGDVHAVEIDTKERHCCRLYKLGDVHAVEIDTFFFFNDRQPCRSDLQSG